MAQDAAPWFSPTGTGLAEEGSALMPVPSWQVCQTGEIPAYSLGRLTELRVNANNKVAQERGVARQTVRDKYRRQLKPDVTGTGQFDTLLEAWLRDGSLELRDVLLKHAVDPRDKRRIKDFFEALEIHERAKTQVLTTRYERDPVAREECLKHYGSKCVICGFSFGEVYGPEAEGIIHIHYLVPLSEMGSKYEVDPIKDLRPVCPNCHAVIHKRHKQPYSIEEVKQMLVCRKDDV